MAPGSSTSSLLITGSIGFAWVVRGSVAHGLRRLATVALELEDGFRRCAQTIPAASGASIIPASSTDPFYIVDDNGDGYQIAGTGHDAPVLTVPSGNRYSFYGTISVKGVMWYKIRNGDGNCLDATTSWRQRDLQ
jgi:hypothetical protein